MADNNNTTKTINIESKDLYLFLLCLCRYGYARHNNAMPKDAFEMLNKYLTEFYKADREWAIHTAKQICEECIGNITFNYHDGDDDNYGNRKLGIALRKCSIIKV